MGKKQKRQKIDTEDAEDLNKMFQMGFVSLEEVQDGKDKGQALKKTKSEWSVVKMPKVLAPPVPSDLQCSSVWDQFGLSRSLVAGILDMGYTNGPTMIQKEMLTNAKGRQHIVGSAPTGSGKTLAFLADILQEISTSVRPTDYRLMALVLCPTRELALQVADHAKRIGKYITSLRVATIVGGMSAEKQQRQLSLAPTLIVATPGRLAELAESDEEGLQKSLNNIKYLVIDEADRMMLDKKGKFPDLESILRHVGKDRRTFLFSATLSTEKLKQAFSTLKKRLGIVKPFEIHVKASLQLDEYKVLSIDQASKDKWMITMLNNKDFSKEKAIVFVNSIEAVRRLHVILSLFITDRPVCPLHAQMQQRQRLKYLDRFKNASDGAILVCSDVASRGLDIPSVKMVIQAEVPTTIDIYRHRVGRTARAGSSGTAYLLLNPKEALCLKTHDDPAVKALFKLPDHSSPSDNVDLDHALPIAYEIENLIYRNRLNEKQSRLESKAEVNIEDEQESLQAQMANKKIAALKNQIKRIKFN